MQEEPLSLSSSVCAPSRRDFLRTCAVSTAAAVPFLRTGKARAAVQRPNILLVFPDQLRFDWTGLNPDVPVRTPNLVRLAEEGSRFETAFCPSPVCAPSRACLALGRQYGRTGVAGNEDNLADGMPTLYSRLRDAGYRVGSTGKLDLRKAAHDWGEDGMHRVNGHVYF
ncbi:MAG: sulfatase-like hydrolase/transferase, partial [Candidatus Hydrogenedentes bacterium]|nr:sulfatase-like hydrolase/transferase [Candidatus Hydrogenedentota bacterium]